MNELVSGLAQLVQIVTIICQPARMTRDQKVLSSVLPSGVYIDDFVQGYSISIACVLEIP